MTDVLSEEEAREIYRATVESMFPPNLQIQPSMDATERVAIAAIIRATSSRPSGAEAMREAVAKALEREADRCEALAQMLSPPSKAPNAELAYLHEQGAALLRDVANRCVRALHIAPQEVSDEMVEAACSAYTKASGMSDPKVWEFGEMRNALHSWMHTALQAALSVKEKKNG